MNITFKLLAIVKIRTTFFPSITTASLDPVPFNVTFLFIVILVSSLILSYTPGFKNTVSPGLTSSIA